MPLTAGGARCTRVYGRGIYLTIILVKSGRLPSSATQLSTNLRFQYTNGAAVNLAGSSTKNCVYRRTRHEEANHAYEQEKWILPIGVACPNGADNGPGGRPQMSRGLSFGGDYDTSYGRNYARGTEEA